MRLKRIAVICPLLWMMAGDLSAADWPAWLPHEVRIGEVSVQSSSDQRLEVSGIEAHRDGEGLDFSASSIVTKDAAGVAMHQPLQIELSAPMTGNLAVAGSLRNASGDLRLFLDLPRGSTALRVTLEPLRFAPGALQPSALLPALGSRLGDVSGTVQAQGSIPLASPGDGSLTVDLSDLSVVSAGLSLDGIASEARFAGLSPLRTSGVQTAIIERITLGVLSGSGELTWRADDGRFRVERAAFASEELTLAITKTHYDPTTAQGAGAVDVEALDVDRLFQLLAVNGLSGSGQVSGTLPFSLVEGGALAIEAGALKADGPGVIRYAPASAPAALAGDNPGLVITRQALENFHYSSLGVTIDGRTNDQMQIGVQLAGSNPDLYGGHPIELNLNLDGALALLAQRVLDARALPDALSRRVLDLLD